MIRPPSAQRPWDTFYSLDSAIIQPPAIPDGELTEEQQAEIKAAIADYRAKIKVAKETGDWRAIVVDGQVPTKFTMAQVDRNVWRAVVDRMQLPTNSHRYIGPAQASAVVFRLAVKAIAGWDAFERLPDPLWDNWTMAPAKIVEQLDEIDQRIVAEIANDVFLRLQGVRPLS